MRSLCNPARYSAPCGRGHILLEFLGAEKQETLCQRVGSQVLASRLPTRLLRHNRALEPAALTAHRERRPLPDRFSCNIARTELKEMWVTCQKSQKKAMPMNSEGWSSRITVAQ